jgi:hypothetical protein
MTPILSDLRMPPIVGQFYMVPTVLYEWGPYTEAWPVIGPMHHDKGPINFPTVHYHIDGRFLSKRFQRFAYEGSCYNGATFINGSPLHCKSHLGIGSLPSKPTLARRKCTNLDYKWSLPLIATRKKWKLPQTYGEPAQAIHLKDGRMLCPHRKANLSSFEPDNNGIVVCPLHGMAVYCGRSKDALETARG